MKFWFANDDFSLNTILENFYTNVSWSVASS